MLPLVNSKGHFERASAELGVLEQYGTEKVVRCDKLPFFFLPLSLQM